VVNSYKFFQNPRKPDLGGGISSILIGVGDRSSDITDTSTALSVVFS